MTESTGPVVLVVEDDRQLADLYTDWLAEIYAVRTAYDGDSALRLLDNEVDVVLLDRLMPDLSGDTVLETVRARDLDCRVAMVTAVKPDFDIVEMGFDEYLVKPVYRDDLSQTVETLLTRAAYVEQFREYHALADKRVVLETEKTDAELDASDEYTALTTKLVRLREQLENAESKWTTRDDFGTVFRRIAQRMTGRGDDER